MTVDSALSGGALTVVTNLDKPLGWGCGKSVHNLILQNEFLQEEESVINAIGTGVGYFGCELVVVWLGMLCGGVECVVGCGC